MSDAYEVPCEATSTSVTMDPMMMMQDGWHDQRKKLIQCTSTPLLQNTNS